MTSIILTIEIKSCRECPYREYDRDGDGLCLYEDEDQYATYTRNVDGINETCPLWAQAKESQNGNQCQ